MASSLNTNSIRSFNLFCIYSTIVIALTTIASFSTLAVTPVERGHVLWQNNQTEQAGQGSGTLLSIPPHGNVLFITNAVPNNSATHLFHVPVENMRGTFVFLSADVRAEGISAKPHPWNGIKVMAIITTIGGKQYPQPELPVGTFEWRHASTRILIPSNTVSLDVVVGLEQVTGKAWFSNLQMTYSKTAESAAPAPANQPIYRGHNFSRLRGAMISPASLRESDLKTLSLDWGANLIRWQLIQTAHDISVDSNYQAYDKWLDAELAHMDEGLRWAGTMGTKIVIDLHSPPGGLKSSGGYKAAIGDFWTDTHAQNKFVQVWQKIAQRYKGDNRIWGYDLVNEPVDDNTSETCMDWQELSLATAKAIREIDPQRTLIIEPPQWGSAQGFVGFHPIPVSNIVYSFHFYLPMEFTHQGVFGPSEPVTYPGRIAGVDWNKTQIQAAMAPAIEFAQRYRVHMYVGEFSAIRWAPGAEKYISDLIDTIEDHGWDWTYHAYREWDGWSVEHGTNKNDHTVATSPTPRKQVLLKWFQKDERAK
mgnify:CR=1 FL=1